MSDDVYGPLSVSGTVAQRASIGAIGTQTADRIGSRIDPVRVVWKTAAQMPEYAPGKHAYGYWKGRQREIWLYNAIPAADVGPTLGHEIMHVLDDDYLDRAKRTSILPLITPTPDNWHDTYISNRERGYPAKPYECFAVYASAAIYGIKPVYVSIYLRRIAATDWPHLREISLT